MVLPSIRIEIDVAKVGDKFVVVTHVTPPVGGVGWHAEVILRGREELQAYLANIEARLP